MQSSASLTFRAVVAPLLGLLLAACSGGPALPDLTTATAIHIQDDWNGLSPDAPLSARYTLVLIDGVFSGAADFSVAGGAKTASTDAVLPPEVAEEFLKTLAESPVKNGDYVPLIEHTDDYPSLVIEIDLGTEKVLFFSQSQGADHVPWGATFGGETYVVDSDAPARALKVLEPYLSREIIQELIDEP
ncbi:MAG TPA: hypothetical protein VI547_11525 [Anaerolineales bacterium]|nr:hypothetical protein [Anaerolineales bacterium]